MSAEIIQFVPRARHDRDDFETMAVKMARQLIQFAKEGGPKVEHIPYGGAGIDGMPFDKDPA